MEFDGVASALVALFGPDEQAASVIATRRRDATAVAGLRARRRLRASAAEVTSSGARIKGPNVASSREESMARGLARLRAPRLSVGSRREFRTRRAGREA
jgi:hypothetical protein